MEGVGVTVLETAQQAPTIPRQCGDCVRTWRATGLGPLIEQTDWQNLAIETMVRCGLWYGVIHPLSCSLKDERLQLLALAVEGARRHDFSNGQSKCLTYELVRLI